MAEDDIDFDVKKLVNCLIIIKLGWYTEDERKLHDKCYDILKKYRRYLELKDSTLKDKKELGVELQELHLNQD